MLPVSLKSHKRVESVSLNHRTLYVDRKPLHPALLASSKNQGLTVELHEHQLQGVRWMYDQEMLDGGSMRHLWAELPPHPLAPTVCVNCPVILHESKTHLSTNMWLDDT